MAVVTDKADGPPLREPAPSGYFATELDGRVAHIRLNRPQALNAMNAAFWKELPALVRALDRAGGTRVIVISSTGPHFSAGMDLAVFATGAASPQGRDPYLAAEAFRHKVAALQETFSCLEAARIPVLAAIQGGVIGGAVDMVTACDCRWATHDAFFQIQEINIGMTADVGTFPRLQRLIPEGIVRELAYTGRRLSAAEAHRLGLLNGLFDSHDALIAGVMSVAREIASKSPLAVTGSKDILNYGRDHTTADTLGRIALWNAAMMAPPHMVEAMSALREKRNADLPDLAPLPEQPL